MAAETFDLLTNSEINLSDPLAARPSAPDFSTLNALRSNLRAPSLLEPRPPRAPEPGSIDEPAATELYRQFKSAEFAAMPADEQARIKLGLNRWADDQIEDDRRKLSDHLGRIYTDLPTLGGWFTATDDGRHVYDDEGRARLANMQFIAAQYGKTPRDIANRYPILRDRYVTERLQKAPMTDVGLYNHLKGEFDLQKRREAAVGELYGQIVLSLIGDAISGQTTPGATVLQGWKDRHQDIGSPSGAQFMVGVIGHMAEIRQEIRPYTRQLKALYDYFGEATGQTAQTGEWSGPQNLEKFHAMVDDLASIPRPVRQRIYAGIVSASQLGQALDEKNAFLPKFAEALGRNVNLLRSMSLNSQEIDAEARINLLKSKGSLFLSEDGELFRKERPDSPLDAPSREISPDERAALLATAEKNLARYPIYRELRSVADNEYDPTSSTASGLQGFLQNGLLNAAGSVGYIATTSVPVVGPYLTFAAIGSDELDKLMLNYPDMAPADARSVAGVSAAAQTVFEVVQIKAAFGKIPAFEHFLKRWANPAITGKGKRIVFRTGALIAGENFVEGAQDLVTPMVQDAAHALKSDIPDVDWDPVLKSWAGTRPDTFAALLPMLLLGVYGVSRVENGRMRSFEYRKGILEDVGFDPEQIERIEEGATVADKQAIAQREIALRKPEVIAAAARRVQARLDDAKSAQESPSFPTRRVVVTRDEAGQPVREHVLLDENGTEITRSTNPEEIDSAQLEILEHRQVAALEKEADEQLAMEDAEDGQLEELFFEKTSGDHELTNLEQPNINEISDEVDAARITEADAAAAVSALAASPSMRRVPWTVRPVAGNELRESHNSAAADLAGAVASLFGRRVVIAETNTADAPFRGVTNSAASLRDVIFIHNRTDRPHMLTMGHELWHHLHVTNPELANQVREALSPEIRSWDDVDAAKADYEPGQRLDEVIGDLLGDSLTDSAFWERLNNRNPGLFRRVASVVNAWLTRVSRALQRMGYGSNAYFKDIERAKDILADAVSEFSKAPFSSAGRVGPYRPADLNESFYSERDDSKAVGGRLTETALAKMDRSPRERLAILDRVKVALRQIGDSHKANGQRQRVAVDPAAALEQLEQERGGTLGDLEIDEQTAISESGQKIVEQFAHRIEAAKNDASRRALEREAKARAVERRRAIQKQFAERRKAVNADFKTKAHDIKREADRANSTTAREEHEASVRSQYLTNVGRLRGILRALPAEVREKVGGFEALARLGGSEKTQDRFFAERLEMVDRELEAHMQRDYRNQIDALLKKTQAKRGENRVQRSALGDEAQKLADLSRKASLLDADATSERLAEIDGALAAAETPERISELAEEWSIVNLFGDLKNRDTSQLAEAYRWLSQIVRTGRGKWRIQEEARLAGVRGMQDEALSIVGHPTKEGQNRERKLSRAEKFLEHAEAFTLSHYSFLQLLDAVLPGASFVERWQQSARRADSASQDFTRRAVDRLNKVVQDAVGSRSWLKTASTIEDLMKPRLGAIQTLEGRSYREVKIRVSLAEKIVRGELAKSTMKAAETSISDALEAEGEVIANGELLPKLTNEDIDQLREDLAMRRERLAEQDFESMDDSNAKHREGSEYLSVRLLVNHGIESDLTVSKLDAIQFRLSWLQPDVRAHMERDGFTEKSIRQMEELTSDSVSQAVMAHFATEYDGGYSVMNPVYRRQFGMNMPRVKNYAPSRYHHAKEAGDIAPFGGVTEQSGSIPGFAKTRVNHRARVRQMDALTVYWQHVAQQSHWVHFSELTREMRGVLQSPDVSQALQQAYGDNVTSQITRWLDVLASQGNSRAAELLIDSKILDSLTTAAAIKALGLNFRSVLMQTDSVMRFVMAMPMRDIVSALGDVPNLFKSLPAAWNSDTVQRRLVNGASPEARFLIDRSQAKPSHLLKLAELSMMPMQYFDATLTSLSGAIVYRDAYRKARATGESEAVSEDAAADAMDDAVARYSQPVGLVNRSLREVSGNRALKLFMLFMSDARLKTALYSEAVSTIDSVDASKEQRMGAFRRLIALQTMAMLSHTLANVFRSYFSDEDDDKIWTAEGYAKAFFLAPLQGYFLLGAAADVVISKALQMPTWGRSENPILSVIESGSSAAKNWEDVWNPEDPDAMLREWSRIADSAAIAGPASAVPAAITNAIQPILGRIGDIEKNQRESGE